MPWISRLRSLVALNDQAFQFLDPGSLIDGDLELVPPDEKWIDDDLFANQHPETLRVEPFRGQISRQQLADFVRSVSGGKQFGNGGNLAPAYHFLMHLSGPGAPLRIAGNINLRIGDSEDLRMYGGHIGYTVYPPARGRHLAERSARLLFPLARRHGLKEIWITCNPDNFASRRTCERLGATLVDTVPVPVAHPLYVRGDRQKCRFLIRLDG